MVCPPLTITREELDEGLAILDEALAIADEYYTEERSASAAAPRWSGGSPRGSARVPFQARLLRGRGRRLSRSRLEQLDEAGLAPPRSSVGARLARARRGAVDDAELKAARRRAMLVLAAGGDPHRELGLGDVAVERLAEELDPPERRAALPRPSSARRRSAGLPTVTGMLATLRDDPELAWRTYALALLADELADDDR